jgi:hypothetical protein
MPPEPVSADPGWDDDLAWLDRDPERESWLDRAREHDEPPLAEEYENREPLTEQELAGIRDAAADVLLAVEAASTGRRGPGQPGSARVFPGESSSPAAAFGPGMVFDVLPGCAQLAVAADAAAEDDRFAGVSEAELVGVLCAWDRVEAHAAARKLAIVAILIVTVACVVSWFVIFDQVRSVLNRLQNPPPQNAPGITKSIPAAAPAIYGQLLPGQRYDLLPVLDPAKDAAHGKFRRIKHEGNESLLVPAESPIVIVIAKQVGQVRPSHLNFPLIPRGDYQLRITLARTTGNRRSEQASARTSLMRG